MATTTVRFVNLDGTATDIRFQTKGAGRLAARLATDPGLHYPGWKPYHRAAFVVASDEQPSRAHGKLQGPCEWRARG
jgi:hypothetical protein